jgi:hypothetical protein
MAPAIQVFLIPFIILQFFKIIFSGDPTTKRFIENFEPVFGYPRIVRFSWATSVNALKGVAYDMEFEEEVNEENPKAKKGAGSKKVTSFFKADPTVTRKIPRHTFFKERFIQDTVDF